MLMSISGWNSNHIVTNLESVILYSHLLPRCLTATVCTLKIPIAMEMTLVVMKN